MAAEAASKLSLLAAALCKSGARLHPRLGFGNAVEQVYGKLHATPQGKPLAMTSLRQSSPGTLPTFKSLTKVCVAADACFCNPRPMPGSSSSTSSGCGTVLPGSWCH